MCEQCNLVHQAVTGEIDSEHIHHLHDFFVIIDDPDSDDKIVIYRTHKHDPLQIFINAMTDKAIELFPDLRVWYNSANPPGHFNFRMKPLPKGAKR